ncbi:alpha/beta-hydrolase [Clavulina sp. PMI_390]|nr:alpha/beta-hydrolase [Clavulina sp. PMI_390]
MTLTNTPFEPSVTGTVKRIYIPRTSWQAVNFWWGWRLRKFIGHMILGIFRIKFRIRRAFGKSTAPRRLVLPKGPQVWHFPPDAKLVNRLLESDQERVFGQWTNQESGWVMTIVSPPPTTTIRRTILYFHGSGFQMPILPWHWSFVGYLSRWLDAEVAVVPYPLGTNNPGPEWRPSLVSVYREFLDRAGDKEAILAGDSAGGILCHGLAHELHAANLPLPHQIVAISPLFDILMGKHEDMTALEPYDNMLSVQFVYQCMRVYAGVTVPMATALARQIDTIPIPPEIGLNPSYSPINGNPAIFKEAGTKLTIVSAEWDLLHPEADSYIDKLATAKVDITYIVGEKQFHCFPISLDASPECAIGADMIIDAIVKNGEDFHQSKASAT